MRTIIGIDCGLSGAIAFLDPPISGFSDWEARAFAVPVIRSAVKKGQRRRTYFDAQAIRRLFEGRNAHNCVVFIELAQVMRRAPKAGRAVGLMARAKAEGGGPEAQGSVANFSIGRWFGWWDGFFSALSIETHIISPRTWQSTIFAGQKPADTKTAAILTAQRMFPDVDLRRTEKCTRLHDGIADALLLAAYGRRFLRC